MFAALLFEGFSYIDQDMFCVILLKYKRSHGWPLLLRGEVRSALERAYSYEWASLPPGRYGQPSKTMTEALSIYEDYFEKEMQGITDLHIKYGFLKEIFNV